MFSVLSLCTITVSVGTQLSGWNWCCSSTVEAKKMMTEQVSLSQLITFWFMKSSCLFQVKMRPFLTKQASAMLLGIDCDTVVCLDLLALCKKINRHVSGTVAWLLAPQAKKLLFLQKTFVCGILVGTIHPFSSFLGGFASPTGNWNKTGRDEKLDCWGCQGVQILAGAQSHYSECYGWCKLQLLYNP